MSGSSFTPFPPPEEELDASIAPSIDSSASSFFATEEDEIGVTPDCDCG